MKRLILLPAILLALSVARGQDRRGHDQGRMVAGKTVRLYTLSNVRLKFKRGTFRIRQTMQTFRARS
jgi:hypothetical protein